MISCRSYKKAYSEEKALAIILEESGRQFDPKLGPLFVQMVQEGIIRSVQNENS